ncbi:hypothetical protein X975_25706, partial [Stegodyphus mimosarum]
MFVKEILRFKMKQVQNASLSVVHKDYYFILEFSTNNLTDLAVPA